MKPQLGDIIIFKAGNNFFSKCIAWLTDSDVSHAAMFYGENAIVEVGADGTVISNVEYSEGEDTYLMRLTPNQNPTPLLHSADRYITAKTHYDFPSLVFLGGLLIYKKIKPTETFLSISKRILMMACQLLDNTIQKYILKNPDGAVVCSQLVYQIYNDCGPDYQIQIKNGNFENSISLDSSERSLCLIDLLSEENDLSYNIEQIPQEELVDEKVLIEQLYKAMTETDSDMLQTNSSKRVQELASIAGNLLNKLEQLLKLLCSDMPVSSLFVTPSDLAYHADNLENVGTMKFKYVRKTP